MSNSNRIIGVALGLIFLLGASAMPNQPSQQREKWQGQKIAQIQQQDYGAIKSFHPDFIDWISAKFGVTGCGPYLINRKGYDPKVGQEEYYRACDLEAQESNANSTRWLLLIAAFQTALTIVGTGLVWRSLRLTRKAVIAANDAVSVTREIGRDQTRAYVHMKTIKWLENGDAFVCTCFVENSGETPCIRFKIVATMTTIKPGETVKNNVALDVKEVGWSALPGHEVFTCVIRPVPAIPIEQIIDRGPEDLFIVAGQIEYWTYFEEKFISEFSFMGKGRGVVMLGEKNGTRMSRTTVPIDVFKRA